MNKSTVASRSRSITKMQNTPGRREVLMGAGAGILAGLSPSFVTATTSEAVLFGSAFQDKFGRHGLAILSGNGKIISQTLLPSRGHDVVFDHQNNRCVTFARRPGVFALAVDLTGNAEPQLFHCPPNRHFYGHGAFSADGKLLYASENDFENATGKIAIYDATDRFRRIGEFPSFGVGPHEILLDNAGINLIVANGGIETHPEFGRRKLNRSSMQPSLAYINAEDGALMEIQQLPVEHHQLSIRHLTLSRNNEVLFGCQDESWFPGLERDKTQPLVGRSRRGGGINLAPISTINWQNYNGYIGSIQSSSDLKQFAISSPKSGLVTVLDSQAFKMLRQHNIPQVSGVSRTDNGFQVSSAGGYFGKFGTDAALKIPERELKFENHLAILR